MSVKLLKYGLGVMAPAAPEGLGAPVETERIVIPAGADAGQVALDFDGVAGYDIALGEGSRATFVSAPPSGRAVSARLFLAAGASAAWQERCEGREFIREDVMVTLAGEGASYEARSIFRAGRSDIADLRHEVVHAAPRTISDLRLRGAVDGSAKAFIRGLVRIPKGMPGCVGRQKEEILMLSDTAEVSTQPDLEIASHDVRCGHAASIGRIDPEKLHYFASRGIAREEATRMIVEGFLAL